jgi:hypothetical protein
VPTGLRAYPSPGPPPLRRRRAPWSLDLGELRDRFPVAVFRVAVSHIFGLPSSRILSTLRSPNARASCHLSVQAMRGAFKSAGIDMSDDAWAATAFSDHMAQCGGDASVHTAHSWLVTSLAEIISRLWCTRSWRRGSHGPHDVRRPPRGYVGVL